MYFKGYPLKTTHLPKNSSFLGSNFFMWRAGSVSMSVCLSVCLSLSLSFSTDNLSLHIDQAALRQAIGAREVKMLTLLPDSAQGEASTQVAHECLELRVSICSWLSM